MERYEFNRLMKICQALLYLAEEGVLDLTDPGYEKYLEELDKVYKENYVIV